MSYWFVGIVSDTIPVFIEQIELKSTRKHFWVKLKESLFQYYDTCLKIAPRILGVSWKYVDHFANLVKEKFYSIIYKNK